MRKFLPFISILFFFSCVKNTDSSGNGNAVLDHAVGVPGVTKSEKKKCLDSVFDIIAGTELFKEQNQAATDAGATFGLQLEESPFPDRDNPLSKEPVNHYQVRLYSDMETHRSVVTRLRYMPETKKLLEYNVVDDAWDTEVEFNAALLKEVEMACL